MSNKTEQRKIISQFNEHPNTDFLQKLLDIRESGMDVFVPKCFVHYLHPPSNRESHYKLTRELIELPLVPPSSRLTETMKRHIKIIESENGTIIEDDQKMKIDTSFWPLALAPNRGASKLYVWEHILYRDVMNDYLRRLESLFRICPETLENFNEALNHISSLYFFTVPVRFCLGKDGIFASENLVIDYIMTSFPNLYRMMFPSKNEEEEGEGDEEGVVKAINPVAVEDVFGNYVKIVDNELEIIHDPKVKLDSSWTEEEGYSIYWWFPDSISQYLDMIVIDSKESQGKMDDFID